MDLNQFWQTTLSEIELQISRPNFATWLKNSQLLDKKDGIALIALPNHFAKNWVENKYHKVILGALRNQDKTTKNVEYVVQNSMPAQTVINSKTKKSDQEAIGQQPFPELKIDPETNLNPKYTLNSFVVGKSNEMAFAAATAILREPGQK